MIPHVRLCAGPAYRSLLRVVERPADGSPLARQIAFAVVAVAVIVAYSDIRIPLRLPGHRGLVWLTLLVAVALVTRRRETVIAVGAASTLATLTLHGAGLWGSARYVVAAVLLYGVTAAPWVRRRRWSLALAAAPIHLVAQAGSVFTLLGRQSVSALASVGIAERMGLHLIFGLIAGLLALAIAFGMECSSSANPAGDMTGHVRQKE